MFALTPTSSFLLPAQSTPRRRFPVFANNFPPFLPKQVENIKDSFARNLAARIQRLPVNLSEEYCIMSSCVKPSVVLSRTTPVVLLHGFDSSCLEWRYTFPLLEEAGVEAWALDILGWGFSDLERLPSCDVASKRNHLYQFWRSHIRRPITLVGPSLGAAIAVDFTINYPDAVENLILIDASVYAEGTGDLAKLPKTLAYAGASILKSTPLRLYANLLCFNDISLSTAIDWMNVGRLHCLYPWWEDATVSFMLRGGYNVSNLIDKVEKRTLIIWGEDDRIISNKLAVINKTTPAFLLYEGFRTAYATQVYGCWRLRLHCELPNAILRQIPDCGHIPHVEKPNSVTKLMVEFIGEGCYKEVQTAL